MNNSINNLNLFTDNSWINFSSDLTDNDINFHLENLLQNISEALNVSEETINSYVKNQGSYMQNQRDALPLVSTITVFYGFIFVAGILGNLITCIVISRNKSMHTATNYYLFNLAISDLILLLSGLPPEMYSMWYPMSYPFSDSICIIESTLLETATNATVLTITAFSVERYIAICHPFRQHTMSKLSRAIKFIFAIWLTAFILALPQAMQFSVIITKKGKMCSVKDGFLTHVFAVSGCIFFVGPMTAICVLYVLIGIKLKKSKLLQGVKRYDLNRGISAQTRVIRMLIAVAVAFFLCWAPFHVQRLMAVYGSTLKNPPVLFEIIYDIMNYASGLMYFLSTCINPLLYNIMSHKFRNAFKLTLARQFGLASRYQTQNNNYYSALTRQNGSMRLNMTILDNRSTNRTVGTLNKRESDSSLLAEHSLMNRSSVGGVGGCGRTSNRFRCVSVSSQATLLTTLSKTDMFSTNNQIQQHQQHQQQQQHRNQNNIDLPSQSSHSIHQQTTKRSNQLVSGNDDLQISPYDEDAVGCECGEHQKPRIINSNQYHQTKSLPNTYSITTTSSSSSSSGVSSSSRNIISLGLDDGQQKHKKSFQKLFYDTNQLQMKQNPLSQHNNSIKMTSFGSCNSNSNINSNDNNYKHYNTSADVYNDDVDDAVENVPISSKSLKISNNDDDGGDDDDDDDDNDKIIDKCDKNNDKNELSLFELKDNKNTKIYDFEKIIANDYQINSGLPEAARQISPTNSSSSSSSSLKNLNSKNNIVNIIRKPTNNLCNLTEKFVVCSHNNNNGCSSSSSGSGDYVSKTKLLRNISENTNNSKATILASLQTERKQNR